MQKIKVLFIQSQTYFGADSLIHSLLMRYLDRGEFEVHAACNVGDQRDPSPAFRALSRISDLHVRPTHFGTSVRFRPRAEVVREALTSGLPAAGSLLALVAYIRKHRIDILHCTEKPRDAFIGVVLARLAGAKCVVQVHVKADRWFSPLVQWAMRRSDSLIGVSAFVAESIVAAGYPADKVHVVLNAIDVGTWPSDVDGGAIRREFGIPAASPLVVAISRLFMWKGHIELLKALALAKAEVPNVKLLIVGEDDLRGTPGRGSFTAELKALAQELGIAEQVIFAGFRADVPAILAASDIFSMPSFEEPFGMVFLEALAMKRPVVALDSGGTSEVVEHGKCGLLSAPGDVEQLSQNIVRLVQDPELRRKMGEAGRERATQQFTPRRMACDVGRIYRQLIVG